MTVTYEISRDHNIYPNLTVYDRFADGEPRGWRVDANEGYVFYDESANDTERNPDTMEEVPVTYYYKNIHYPRTFNWGSFHLVAVLRSTAIDDNVL